MSPDPLLASGRIENAQTWNRYNYVLNNPLKYSDPLGLFEYMAGTSAADMKRINKAYDDLVAARDKYRAGSKEYNAINKALTALGAPGVKNGVLVYVDNTQATPGSTNGSPAVDANTALATGKAEATVGINLSMFKDDDAGKAQLAGLLGHEGTHVADHQSEAAKVAGLGWGDINQMSQAGQIMSRAITEVHAYRVSAYVAAAITPSNIINSKYNGYEIWNRGWSAADAETKREAGIRGVLQSPLGTYKYNYQGVPFNIPGVPFFNNSLDEAHKWTKNGGPLW